MKIVIMILGLPGAGKGTQAEFLAKKFGIYHFETSKIIEERLKKGGSGIAIERKKWKRGELNTPSKVSRWVIEKVKDLSKKSIGIVFSGSPRTLEESEKIYPIFLKEYNSNVFAVNMRIKPRTAIFRNTNRRICEKCRHPFVYNDKKIKDSKKCPICGGKLIIRELDKPQIIKRRLEVYNKQTKPVLDYFRKKRILDEIDGEGTVKEVNKRILNLINKKLKVSKFK